MFVFVVVFGKYSLYGSQYVWILFGIVEETSKHANLFSAYKWLTWSNSELIEEKIKQIHIVCKGRVRKIKMEI